MPGTILVVFVYEYDEDHDGHVLAIEPCSIPCLTCHIVLLATCDLRISEVLRHLYAWPQRFLWLHEELTEQAKRFLYQPKWSE